MDVQHRNQFLPKDIKIVGYARTKMDHEEYLRRVKSYIKTPTKDMEQQLEDFCKLCTYVSGQYDEDDSFITLNKHLEEIEQGRKEQNRVFYMALPPSVFITVSQHLKKNCYPKNGISRIIVEKPFGKDLASSRDLQRALEPDWKEEEIFRIDHYLGKEMVKNILILRFGNEFFGATWNRNHIDNVQISFKEPFGTEGRGATLTSLALFAMSCKTICYKFSRYSPWSGQFLFLPKIFVMRKFEYYAVSHL